MSFYAANADRGRRREPRSPAPRESCARCSRRGSADEVAVATMMDAIEFEPYPDAAPALAALRGGGCGRSACRTGTTSFRAVLERIGLAAAIDGVVTSAVAGARKPDPAIFAPALALAGCAAAEALHVGDSDEDVAGAHAAGHRRGQDRPRRRRRRILARRDRGANRVDSDR